MELLEIEKIVNELNDLALYRVAGLEFCQREDCIYKQQYFDPPTDLVESIREYNSRYNRLCGKGECLWGCYKDPDFYDEHTEFPQEIEKRLEILTAWLLELNGKTPTKAEQYLIGGIVRALDVIKDIVEHPLMTKRENKVMRLRGLYYETEKRLEWYTVKAAPTPQPTKETQLHFNSSQSSEQLTKIFQALKDGGCFDANARLDMWLYACGVADLNGEFEPLNWVADKQLLGVLVTKLFDNDKRRYWKVAQRVFVVGGGTITEKVVDGMKNSVSKIGNDWRNAPAQADQLLAIIAGK